MHDLPCSFPLLASWSGVKPQGDLGTYVLKMAEPQAAGSLE